MSAAEILSYLTRCTTRQRLEFQLVMQCAPVLKNVKVSNLLTVRAGEWQQVCEELRDSRIIAILLYADGRREVVFCCRYEQLEAYLMRPEVRGFLWDCGYGRKLYDVASVVRRLRRRYQQYAGAGKEFPHELGVLLGYPVEDVRGFIANGGQGGLLSGYWKVYGDVEGAKQKFRVYDEAKECALQELMSGWPLRRVAEERLPGETLQSFS